MDGGPLPHKTTNAPTYCPVGTGPEMAGPSQGFSAEPTTLMTAAQPTPESAVPAETPATPAQKDESTASVAYYLGYLHMALAIMCIVFNIGAIAASAHVTKHVAPGIWVGVLVMITGIISVAASKKKSKGLMILFLLLSIMSAILSLAIIVCAVVGLAEEGFAWEDGYISWSWVRTIADYVSQLNRHKLEPRYAMNGILLICGVTEGIVAILSSGISCAMMCGDDSSRPRSRTMVQPVQYIMQNGQPHIVMMGRMGGQTTGNPMIIQAPQIMQGGQAQGMYAMNPSFSLADSGVTCPPAYSMENPTTLPPPAD